MNRRCIELEYERSLQPYDPTGDSVAAKSLEMDTVELSKVKECALRVTADLQYHSTILLWRGRDMNTQGCHFHSRWRQPRWGQTPDGRH